jgi:hypothetical protein
MHSELRSKWCMIAETANLATAHKLVKRALTKGSFGRDRYFNETPELNGRNVESATDITTSDVLTLLQNFRREQKGQSRGLMLCRPEKPRRSVVYMLPGGGTSE